MKAILIGATGATGSDLLTLLLSDTQVDAVLVFVRRPLPIQHPKLTTHIIDFEKPTQWQSQVKGDVLFSCLGTTLKDAGSKENQWKIDHDYPYQFAQMARQNGLSTLVLVSSAMASPRSKIFYSRMKGVLEEAVKALDFPHLLIFRPPALIRKHTNRKGEQIGVRVVHFFNALGLLKTYRPLPTEHLAQAMLYAVKNHLPKQRTLEGKILQTEVEKSLAALKPTICGNTKSNRNFF